MKKIAFLVGIIIALSQSSCSDFLEDLPMTQKVDENFYQTPQDMYEAMVGCYKILQKEENNNLFQVAEAASDNVYGGGGVGDGPGSPYDEFKMYTTNDFCSEPWTNKYSGIYRCNMFLEKYAEKDWGKDADLIRQYAAEVHFLRAYYYFYLIRIYGNIPLITSSISDNPPQAPAADVYKLIAEDLKFAVENLPAVPVAEMNADDYGRITKWAAQAMMARVFLFYTGYYKTTDLEGVVSKSDVLGYLEDLIANSGHDLLPDFRSLWAYGLNTQYLAELTGDPSIKYIGEGKQNIESVFVVKYSPSGAWGKFEGAHWIKYLGWRSGNWDPIAQGWGIASCVNPKLWNAYSSDDTRKTGSILSVKDEGSDYQTGDQRDETYYWQKKYTPVAVNGEDRLNAEGVNTQYGQPYDFMVIRYADVLLMAAELGSPNAQNYFDKVRDRAFKDTDHRLPLTEENLREERRLEFAFECIRYYDLLRYGLDYAKSKIDEVKVVYNKGVKEEIPIVFPIECGGFFQIPYAQIRLSNYTLKQNEYWIVK